MADTETDAEIVTRLRGNPDAARAIEALAWEIRHGDRYDKQRAERDLTDHATRREIAAVKRHLKS